MVKVVSSTICFILWVSQIQMSCFTKREPLNAKFTIATRKPLRSGKLCGAHDKNISVNCQSDSSKKYSGKPEVKNVKLYHVEFQFQKQQQTFSAEWLLLWQKQQQQHEVGFQVLTVKSLLMIWIILRNPRSTETTQNFKGPNNSNKKVGRRHQLPSLILPSIHSTLLHAREMHFDVSLGHNSFTAPFRL